MKPHFIIGGVMKSGTTFLTNLLVHHSSIKFLKRDMKYSFFDDNRIYKKGEKWYASLFEEFDNQTGNVLIGQTSADCAFNPNSTERAIRYNPDVKMIFVLRHPVDRAYSLYWHQYAMGREKYHFEEAIAAESKRIKKSYYNFKNYSYVERSRYKQQFKEVIQNVPEKQLLLLDFESLTKDTKNSINKVLDFLNIPKITDLEELNYSKLPRNPANIPKSHYITQLSYYLQKIGLVPIGRRIAYKTSKEERPPKMSSTTRVKLETELKEDIAFYEQVKAEFKSLIQS